MNTDLRDRIRKKNNYSAFYNLENAISGNGLLLAGQTRPMFNLSNESNESNEIEPEIPIKKPKPKPIPKPIKKPIKKPIPKPFKPEDGFDDFKMTGVPNRTKGLKLVPKNTKGTPVKGRPINIKTGQFAELSEALEAGDAAPFLSESAAALGELLMGFL
tara:strand:+ start:590 stop:1066 length:477 start_codon:yes stop_codon:yes gene_type:complete